MLIRADVRFGSIADIVACPLDVRFTPNSGQTQRRSVCPLSAISDQTQRNKQHQRKRLILPLGTVSPFQIFRFPERRPPHELQVGQIGGVKTQGM
jgi:hypothetical protein